MGNDLYIYLLTDKIIKEAKYTKMWCEKSYENKTKVLKDVFILPVFLAKKVYLEQL